MRRRRGARARRKANNDGWIGRLGRLALTGILLLLVVLIGGSRLGLFGSQGGESDAGEAGAVMYSNLVAESKVVPPPDEAQATHLWRPLRGVHDSPEPPAQDEAGGASESQEGAIGSQEGAFESQENAVDMRERAAGSQESAGGTQALAGMQEGSTGSQTPAYAGSGAPSLASFRVYIANGCRVDGLAAGLRDDFRAAGFDVCGVSDADRGDYTETLVIDRCGNPAGAQRVCAFLQEHWGVGRILLQNRAAAMTDVLVILGTDIAARRQPAYPLGSANRLGR